MSDDQDAPLVVLVPHDELPECWARGWCSDACKALALDVLARGQLVTLPLRGPQRARSPFLNSN